MLASDHGAGRQRRFDLYQVALSSGNVSDIRSGAAINQGIVDHDQLARRHRGAV
jgi:hypothetical protein